MLSASMLACHGRVQREGEVVHVVADRLEDLSALLRSVGERDAAACPDGPGPPRNATTRQDVGTGIRVPTRDFR